MMATKKVVACIDASPYAQATCDAAIWATQKLQAPLALLHVLDKAVHHAAADLSGSIGLGSQEALLQQLAEHFVNVKLYVTNENGAKLIANFI
jgi:nucleotide-binding universal stress UspA family protein